MAGGLARQLRLPGAVAIGFGSIVGTGVFVSLGIAVGLVGPLVIYAIGCAACIAIFSGLSSAQLAAAHPISGGTYEYGYRWLNPTLGFVAGWTFLVAKSLSAATAALGVSAYALTLLDISAQRWVIGLALGVIAAMTLLVSGGIRRSVDVNYGIVAVTLVALGAFLFAALPSVVSSDRNLLFVVTAEHASSPNSLGRFFESVAILFVAFTGYGRIATMGEEVVRPDVTIPRAIVVTLAAVTLLYSLVGWAAVGSVGSEFFKFRGGLEKATMLQSAIEKIGHPEIGKIVAVGAIVAMLGVLLNLILGLSRVVLAMGRRGDLPVGLAVIDVAASTPRRAVLLVGIVVGLLAMIGDVRTTWTYSAFAVLIYYALTNLSALRMEASERRYPGLIAWGGLVSCLALVFWVPVWVMTGGAILIAAGLAGRFAFRKLGGLLDR